MLFQILITLLIREVEICLLLPGQSFPCEIFQQLLDRQTLHFVHDLLWLWRATDFSSITLTWLTFGWIAMKFGTHINVSLRIDCMWIFTFSIYLKVTLAECSLGSLRQSNISSLWSLKRLKLQNVSKLKHVTLIKYFCVLKVLLQF